MYKKAFARRIGGNKHLIHLWTDTGYEKVEWTKSKNNMQQWIMYAEMVIN